MASNQQILREYLISLGFRTDAHQQRKFDLGIDKTSFNVAALAKTVLGVGVAANAMVALFARSMERMHYSAKLAGSTVSSLQAVDFAARGIGLSGEAMTEGIKKFGMALRMQPGLEGVLANFGIKVQGRDVADVATDFITALSTMPFYKARLFAEMFGIDAETLFLWQEGLAKFKEMVAVRKAMAAEAGVDPDAAANTAKAYMDMFRSLNERVGLLKDALAIALLEPITEWLRLLDQGVLKLTRWITSKGPQRAAKVAADAIKAVPQAATSYWDYTKKFWGAVMQPGAFSGMTKGKGKPATGPSPMDVVKEGIRNAADRVKASQTSSAIDVGPPRSGEQSLSDSIKLWTKEGAEMFYRDLQGGAQFNSPETMARVMAALTAAQPPSPVVGSAPIVIRQDTTINVGSTDPEAAAGRVAGAQDRVSESAANILRNQRGASR